MEVRAGGSFMTDLVFRSRKQNISYGSVKLITLVSALLVLSACSGLSVHGGQTIETRVDSKVAQKPGSFAAQ
jgi:hypothetical protein